MSYRTTPTLVAGIIKIKKGMDVTPFIAAANSLTTNICGAAGYSDGYEGSTMELIERWLAAHSYTIFDNPLSMARAGSVGAGYQYKVDLCLDSSMYGQMALLLDTKGLLAATSNTAKIIRKIQISMTWLGRNRARCWDVADWSICTIVE